MQPALSAFPVSGRGSLPLQKHLDGEFLCAGGVFDNSGDHTSDAPIMSEKDCFQINAGIAATHFDNAIVSRMASAVSASRPSWPVIARRKVLARPRVT